MATSPISDTERAKTKPLWKPMRGTAKREREDRRDGVKSHEAKNKTAARKGDDYACRFPRCFCHRQKIAPAVAHLDHKGMGGNPAGDRSDDRLLICLCPARHRESRISLDAGSMKVRPLTKLGTRGRCEFYVDLNALDKVPAAPKRPRWFLVATERELHIFEMFSREQALILDRISEIVS